MNEFSNLDQFILYFFLPALAIYLLLSSKHYYKNKQNISSRFHISRDLLVGNIIGSIIVAFIIIGLYLYILNMSQISELRWEFITISVIVILTLLCGIGLGSHLTAISLEKTIDPSIREKFPELNKGLNFFHLPFSHRLVFLPVALIIYALTLLDIFRGKTFELNTIQTLIIIGAGYLIGVILSALSIFSHSTKLMFITSTVFIISIWGVTNNEARNLTEHIIAFFFSIVFFTTSINLAAYRYTRLNSLRKPVRYYFKKWFEWDFK